MAMHKTTVIAMITAELLLFLSDLIPDFGSVVAKMENIHQLLLHVFSPTNAF